MAPDVNNHSTAELQAAVLSDAPAGDQVAVSRGVKRFSAEEKAAIVDEVLIVDRQRQAEVASQYALDPEKIDRWVDIVRRGGRRELITAKVSADAELSELVMKLEGLLRKRILSQLTQSK